MDSFNNCSHSSMSSYSSYPSTSGSTVSSLTPQERRQVTCSDGNTAGSSNSGCSMAGRRKKKKQRSGRGSRGGGGRGGGASSAARGAPGECATAASVALVLCPEDDLSSIQGASVAEHDTESAPSASHQDDGLCLGSIEQQQQQQQQLTTSLMNHILDQKKLHANVPVSVKHTDSLIPALTPELLQSPALQRIIQQKQLQLQQQRQLNT